MNEHSEIRKLLPLSAAGAAEDGEQALVDGHLSECRACREELAGLRSIAGALKSLPVPQPSLGLARRTRARVAAEFAARQERRSHQLWLGALIAFAWLLTGMSFAMARYFGQELGSLFRLSPGQFQAGFLAYTLFGGVGTLALAALLGARTNRLKGGHYEPLSR